MVVDRDHGINVLLDQGTHEVVGTLLHLGVGTLYGVELDAVAVAAGVDTRHGAAAQTNAVVVATHHNDVVAFLRFLLQAVALLAVADAACQHDHLVVAVELMLLLGQLLAVEGLGGVGGSGLIFKGEQRTGDEGLAELVAEVARTIRCLDENLFGSLIEPFAGLGAVLPLAGELGCAKTGIAGHVDSCSGNRPRSYSTAHTVADLTARTRSGAVEGLHGGGEVVGLGFQRDDALDGLHAEPVGRALVGRGKLLHHRSLGKGHVVLVGRENLSGMQLRGLLDHLEEARLALLAVDDKHATEDLVAAVLRVDLRETEDFRVGERASVLLLYLVEVFYLLGTQRQSFLLVVFLDVVHVLDGLGSMLHSEDFLVESLIHAL